MNTDSKPTPRRGDIWFVGSRSKHPGKGEHTSVGTEMWSNAYAVIVSNDRMNISSQCAQVVYLSTSPRRKPTTLHVAVAIPAAPGSPVQNAQRPAVAFCEQVHTVDRSRLYTRRGHASHREMQAIDEAVAWSLGVGTPGTAATAA